jgi:small-conductance mechanosensitive channel
MLVLKKGKMRKGRRVLALALCIGLLSVSQAAVLAQAPDPQPSPGATQEAEGMRATWTASRLLEAIVETRTPVPTATPGWIESEVEQLAALAGLAWTQFLGLSVSEWINLGISLSIVLAAYLLGTALILGLLPRLARRTQTGFDDAILARSAPGLRWLLLLLFLQFATERLTFVSAQVKVLLKDLYFVLALALAARILWQLIDVGERWYTEQTVKTERGAELSPVITLLVRIARVVVVLFGVTVLLGHFGVNVAAITAALGLGGLAFSLAARDTIADAIAGFIILVDRPFRIGDRIEIQGSAPGAT